MYSVKEKLNHFRQLSSPSAAEADLALLREKSSGNTNLIRYGLAPNKNAEDILFDLLDVVTHEEIVRNRREFLAAKEAEEETNNIPDGDRNPEDEKTVVDGEQPDDDTPKDDENPTDESPAPKTEEVEQSNEMTSTEQKEDGEQPATEKKSTSPKKKSTKK